VLSCSDNQNRLSSFGNSAICLGKIRGRQCFPWLPSSKFCLNCHTGCSERAHNAEVEQYEGHLSCHSVQIILLYIDYDMSNLLNTEIL
jgi:hypothetical protein